MSSCYRLTAIAGGAASSWFYQVANIIEVAEGDVKGGGIVEKRLACDAA
jgi:hypothetical protein